MKIEITEKDLEKFLSPEEILKLKGEEKDLLQGGIFNADKIVLKGFSNFIAWFAGRIQPDNFKISEINIELSVKGSPFNIGLESSVSMKYVSK